MTLPENTPLPQTEEVFPQPAQVVTLRRSRQAIRRSAKPWWLLISILTYVFGLASGYGLWGAQKTAEKAGLTGSDAYAALLEQINPEAGYTLPIDFGNLGAQLVEAGVINRDLFIQVYQKAGQPLTDEQLAILDGTFTGQMAMNGANAYFLLNFLWATGLASQNPILDSGPIQKSGQNGIEGFASTGGWTLATRPIREIFSQSKLFALTADQQKRLEEAAAMVYRPCCDNPTNFPDCNHGMAMLGLLELMASQDASLEEMLEAAKYVNAFWYPQQTLEQAVYFQNTEGLAYQDVDAGLLLGRQYSSGSGFKQLHQFLEGNGLLPQAPSSGGSCGV